MRILTECLEQSYEVLFSYTVSLQISLQGLHDATVLQHFEFQYSVAIAGEDQSAMQSCYSRMHEARERLDQLGC